MCLMLVPKRGSGLSLTFHTVGKNYAHDGRCDARWLSLLWSGANGDPGAFGTKCHPGGGPAPGGGPEGPPGAAITWAGVGGFDGWAANQTKDAATPAPPINAPTIKFQIILSLCHASFSPMSHLVF